MEFEMEVCYTDSKKEKGAIGGILKRKDFETQENFQQIPA